MLILGVLCAQDLDAAAKKDEGELELLESGTRNGGGSEIGRAHV